MAAHFWEERVRGGIKKFMERNLIKKRRCSLDSSSCCLILYWKSQGIESLESEINFKNLELYIQTCIQNPIGWTSASWGFCHKGLCSQEVSKIFYKGRFLQLHNDVSSWRSKEPREISENFLPPSSSFFFFYVILSWDWQCCTPTAQFFSWRFTVVGFVPCKLQDSLQLLSLRKSLLLEKTKSCNSPGLKCQTELETC